MSVRAALSAFVALTLVGPAAPAAAADPKPLPLTPGAQAAEPEGPAAWVVREVAELEALSPARLAEALPALRQALSRVESHPVAIAEHEPAQRAHLKALLLLAQVHLSADAGRREAAIEAVDAAIRVARGEPLPDAPSPEVDALVVDRMAEPENAPLGSLAVRCPTHCRVLLDVQWVGSGTEVLARGLPFGPHRLWVLPPEGVKPIAERSVLLQPSSPSYELDLQAPEGPAPPAAVGSTPAPALPRPTRTALGLGIAGVTLGVLMTATGATLLGLHERCRDGSDPRDRPRCEDVFDTQAGGAITLGLGLAVTLGGAVALGLGARARRDAPAQASVGAGPRP